MLTSLFLLYAEDYWNLLKLTYKSFALTSNKTFLKNKKMSGSSLPASFSALFLKENIYLVVLCYWSNFIVWLPLPDEILGNMCIETVC